MCNVSAKLKGTTVKNKYIAKAKYELVKTLKVLSEIASDMCAIAGIALCFMFVVLFVVSIFAGLGLFPFILSWYTGVGYALCFGGGSMVLITVARWLKVIM